MKLNSNQIQYLASKVFNEWKSVGVVTVKSDEKVILSRIISAIKENYQKETELEVEVNKMLDQLEKAHPGEFQRGKMFIMIKQKLAKEKRIIL